MTQFRSLVAFLLLFQQSVKAWSVSIPQPKAQVIGIFLKENNIEKISRISDQSALQWILGNKMLPGAPSVCIHVVWGKVLSVKAPTVNSTTLNISDTYTDTT